jgi:rod shape-determining protein MreC
MGQVVETLPHASVAMLVTDPENAVPIMVARTGLRGIAHGTGNPTRLLVPNLPLSADIQPGDQLVTSGLGGRYPAGFPVGTVSKLERGPAGMFLEAQVKPAAELERSGEVLLLRDQPDPVGPPAPAPDVGPPASLAPATSVPRNPTAADHRRPTPGTQPW